MQMQHATLVIGWRHDAIEMFYDAAAQSELPLFRDDGRKPSAQPLNSAVRHKKAYHARIEHYRELARKRQKKQNDKRAAMRRAVREVLGTSAVSKLSTDFRAPSTMKKEGGQP